MLCIVKQPVVFKIDFKYKQSKNYHPEAHFQSVNTLMRKAGSVTC